MARTGEGSGGDGGGGCTTPCPKCDMGLAGGDRGGEDRGGGRGGRLESHLELRAGILVDATKSTTTMDSSWLREGATAELAYADNGMVGSFYPCSVVQIADADALVEVGGLRDPSNSSNAAREWHPCSRLRPPWRQAAAADRG